MEPLTAIALAKGIASATGLDDWLKAKLGDAIGDTAAETIIDVAKVATGSKTPEEALQAVQENNAKANDVALAIMEREHELKLAVFEDLKSARTMYSQKSDMADRIAERVIKQNVWVVALLLIANGLVLAFVNDKVVAVALGNLIGTSIGALWQERQQVIGFFFGSSWGSKLKDALKQPGR